MLKEIQTFCNASNQTDKLLKNLLAWNTRTILKWPVAGQRLIL